MKKTWLGLEIILKWSERLGKKLNRTCRNKYVTTNMEWLNIRLCKAEKKINCKKIRKTTYARTERDQET